MFVFVSILMSSSSLNVRMWFIVVMLSVVGILKCVGMFFMLFVWLKV